MFGRDDIMSAIASFKPGSAGGPDQLNPQHLKDVTALKLLDAMVEFLNKIFLWDII